jgi:heme/copper-type cytochrome/quinol oxidase subunit 2
MIRFLTLLLFFSINSLVYAQGGHENDAPQMADAMRSNGKIYVVVAVLVTILIGLFIYLISVDRKLTKLEKRDKT